MTLNEHFRRDAHATVLREDGLEVDWLGALAVLHLSCSAPAHGLIEGIGDFRPSHGVGHPHVEGFKVRVPVAPPCIAR